MKLKIQMNYNKKSAQKSAQMQKNRMVKPNKTQTEIVVYWFLLVFVGKNGKICNISGHLWVVTG